MIKITCSPSDLLELYNSGKTLSEIAGLFDASRERIRQLLNRTNSYSSRKKWGEESSAEKFMECVDVSGDCWEWKKSKFPTGYGHMRWNGKPDYAHRVSWRISFGEIPDGMCVCHRCDNPGCVNPKHLFLGTIADNMKDRDEKGRGLKGKNRKLKNKE
jgi:hypothetical protein